MMLKNQIVSELLANRESGVMKVDDDYELDSLAKLEVIAFLENVKAGFLDNCFDAVADAGSLDAILQVFDSYQVVSEVA
jgi:hypothetical protein